MGSKSSKSQNLENIICPECSKVFPSTTTFKDFNKHLKECAKEKITSNAPADVYSPDEDKKNNEIIFQRMEKYIKEPKKKLSEKNKIDFELKKKELKEYIKKNKISWEEGSDILKINRRNILKDSMEGIKSLDLKKEIKIEFIGEVSLDAGGILREWFTGMFTSLESKQLNLFVASESLDFSYIINPFLDDTNLNKEYFEFIGKLIGKALYDNITVNLCFNKLIYKLILHEEITFDDLLTIDNPFYSSFKNLKDMNLKEEGTSDLGLTYSIEQNESNGNIHSFELIQGGKEKKVSNIDDYINKRINFICCQINIFCEKIRESLSEMIPLEIIEKFTSDELELIINGKPFIDIEEWKENTEYGIGYNQYSSTIKWFWEIMENLNQQQLSNFLLFSTGSGRVPLGGFAELESNRGTITKYKINSVDYVPGVKNYIKAHTCFNRIDLPKFPNKQLVIDAVGFIANCQLFGFGIE